MSKKYFVKWLPVEGKINEEDAFFQGNQLIIPHQGKQRNVDGGEMKKAKLFLCSENVLIGDKAVWKSRPDIIVEVNENFLNLHNSYEATLYKIIGEISEEAVWVKEGDEFTEEEVQICTTYISKITRNWIKEGEEYFSYNYNTYSNEKNMIILDIMMFNRESGIQHVSIDDLIIKNTCKILNPSCKHYH